ncbi:MAG: hypothetical protein WBM69_25760 [Desulfobacterales bacterium]
MERKALAARKNVLRLITAGKSGHVGGALSIIDTITALYFKIMKVDPQNPTGENRGLSIGVGMAMGDGELAEGSNWEAAAAASHHKLDNLIVFADRNGLPLLENDS